MSAFLLDVLVLVLISMAVRTPTPDDTSTRSTPIPVWVVETNVTQTAKEPVMIEGTSTPRNDAVLALPISPMLATVTPVRTIKPGMVR